MYKKTGSSYSILLHRGGKMNGRVLGGWWEDCGRVVGRCMRVVGRWCESSGKVDGGWMQSVCRYIFSELLVWNKEYPRTAQYTTNWPRQHSSVVLASG